MNEADTKLLSDVHASTSIDFGTSAPFAFMGLRLERIGFADLPGASLTICCPDRRAIVAVARQYVFREFKLAGYDPAVVLQFVPSINSSSRRKRFTDCNEHSPTRGCTKMGYVHRVFFALTAEGRKLLPPTVWNSGQLPTRQPQGPPHE